MGDAVKRKRAHAGLLQQHPNCIYCGDLADTVEHMPPIMMFRGKDRPRGLEFPSCKSCNNGTSHSDLIASTLGRAMTQESITDRDR